VNVYLQKGAVTAALRPIPETIPSLDDLGIPPTVSELATARQGLVLVTGPTGSGKTTTQAALIDLINARRACHIITVEDPIEYVHQHRRSIVDQREVGEDTDSFATALKYALRQNPDVILVGEMRDLETIQAALTAAETGHLVLGSIHCNNAEQTFSRILEFFERQDHTFIRSSLANSLRAIMVQRLLPGVKEGSRFPATEVLVNNSIVRDKIIREEDEDIPAVLHACRDEGMRDFTQSIFELAEKAWITHDVALDYAPNREALQSRMKGIDTAGQGLISRVRK